jgi:hypothetical protein
VGGGFGVGCLRTEEILGGKGCGMARWVDDVGRVDGLGAFRGWLGDSKAKVALYERGAGVHGGGEERSAVWAFDEVAAIVFSESTTSSTGAWQRTGTGRKRTITTTTHRALRVMTVVGERVGYTSDFVAVVELLRVLEETCGQRWLTLALARLGSGVACEFGAVSLAPEGTAHVEHPRRVRKAVTEDVDLVGAASSKVVKHRWKASHKKRWFGRADVNIAISGLTNAGTLLTLADGYRTGKIEPRPTQLFEGWGPERLARLFVPTSGYASQFFDLYAPGSPVAWGSIDDTLDISANARWVFETEDTARRWVDSLIATSPTPAVQHDTQPTAAGPCACVNYSDAGSQVWIATCRNVVARIACKDSVRVWAWKPGEGGKRTMDRNTLSATEFFARSLDAIVAAMTE